MKKQRPERVRKLSSGHFAFMRAVVQDLDARAAWDRYLRLEGEHVDTRKVRSTIAWIRAEFAGGARRQAKPGTARLVLSDAEKLSAEPSKPTLEKFARSRGMEDFSEAEQAEEYAAAYGGATRQKSRWQQLVNRQLDALRWLEEQVAEDPQPGDAIGAWLAPALATRIERAGMPTLFTLVERINGIGSRWWAGVPGIGELKDARIVEWLRIYEASLGMQIEGHALVRRSALQPGQLAAVVRPSTSLVPLEKFIVPVQLDGSAGRYLAPPDRCMLEANNDHEAILAWLDSKRSGSNGGASSTQRSYRKEAERLLLWSILEREKPPSSLAVQDASAFVAFLTAPPAHWCGPRHHQRWSTLWRPLEGQLSPSAMRQTVLILRSMFAFFHAQNYMVGNPFAGVPLPREGSRELGSRRTLSTEQWHFIEGELERLLATELGRRRARAIRWLYATGLRLAEIVGAKCQALTAVRYQNTEGKQVSGWMLTVIGKGEKERKVTFTEVSMPCTAQVRWRRPFVVDIGKPNTDHVFLDPVEGPPKVGPDIFTTMRRKDLAFSDGRKCQRIRFKAQRQCGTGKYFGLGWVKLNRSHCVTLFADIVEARDYLERPFNHVVNNLSFMAHADIGHRISTNEPIATNKWEETRSGSVRSTTARPDDRQCAVNPSSGDENHRPMHARLS